jgi:hypothetical protein
MFVTIFVLKLCNRDSDPEVFPDLVKIFASPDPDSISESGSSIKQQMEIRYQTGLPKNGVNRIWFRLASKLFKLDLP